MFTTEIERMKIVQKNKETEIDDLHSKLTKSEFTIMEMKNFEI